MVGYPVPRKYMSMLCKCRVEEQRCRERKRKKENSAEVFPVTSEFAFEFELRSQTFLTLGSWLASAIKDAFFLGKTGGSHTKKIFGQGGG